MSGASTAGPPTSRAPLRILGAASLLAGLALLAAVFSGMVAWATPLSDGDTPAGLAGTISGRMLLCVGAGLLLIAGGVFALLRRAHATRDSP